MAGVHATLTQPCTTLDAQVVMPNHVHGIVVIEATEEPAASAEGGQGRHIGLPLQREAGLAGAGRRVRADSNRELAIPRDPSLPRIVQWFKTMTTNDYLLGAKHHGLPPFRNRLWQRNYYEHIIRNERDLDRIRDYISANPSRWAQDDENPNLAARKPL